MPGYELSDRESRFAIHFLKVAYLTFNQINKIAISKIRKFQLAKINSCFIIFLKHLKKYKTTFIKGLQKL